MNDRQDCSGCRHHTFANVLIKSMTKLFASYFFLAGFFVAVGLVLPTTDALMIESKVLFTLSISFLFIAFAIL